LVVWLILKGGGISKMKNKNALKEKERKDVDHGRDRE
jgi:hypothetical protein